MSPLDLNAIPNPDGSPLEKLLSDTVWENIEPHVRSALSENPTKDEILRAFSYYDRVLADYIQRHEQALTYWANIHTHDLVGVGAPLAYLTPPYRLAGVHNNVSGSTQVYTSATGEFWTGVELTSISNGYRHAYDGQRFVITRPQSDSYRTLDKDTLTYSNLNCSAGNDYWPRGVIYNYNTGRYIMGSSEVIYYTDQDPISADENWLPVSVTGLLIGIVWDPSTETYFAMTTSNALFSTDDGLTWEVGGARPGPAYSGSFETLVKGDVGLFNGRWLFGHQNHASAYDIPNSGVYTSVDGADWVLTVPGFHVNSIQDNKRVVLAMGRDPEGYPATADEVVYRSEDAITWEPIDVLLQNKLLASSRFPTLATFTDRYYYSAAWDGTSWILSAYFSGLEADGETVVSGGVIFYTTDPLAKVGWEVSDFVGNYAGLFLF